MPMQITIIIIIQANAEVRARVVLRDLPVPQPVIVVRGSMEHPVDAFLAADRMILCKIEAVNSPLALLAAFYVFNVHYTPGYANFFQALECYFLDTTIPKRARICDFMSEISHITN